jgi:hypothetical protein
MTRATFRGSTRLAGPAHPASGPAAAPFRVWKSASSAGAASEHAARIAVPIHHPESSGTPTQQVRLP